MAKKPHTEERPLTLSQAAALRDVARQTILYWIAKLGMPAHKNGPLWFVWRHDLDAFTPPKGGRPKGWRKKTS